LSTGKLAKGNKLGLTKEETYSNIQLTQLIYSHQQSGSSNRTQERSESQWQLCSETQTHFWTSILNRCVQPSNSFWFISMNSFRALYISPWIVLQHVHYYHCSNLTDHNMNITNELEIESHCLEDVHHTYSISAVCISRSFELLASEGW